MSFRRVYLIAHSIIVSNMKGAGFLQNHFSRCRVAPTLHCLRIGREPTRSVLLAVWTVTFSSDCRLTVYFPDSDIVGFRSAVPYWMVSSDEFWYPIRIEGQIHLRMKQSRSNYSLVYHDPKVSLSGLISHIHSRLFVADVGQKDSVIKVQAGQSGVTPADQKIYRRQDLGSFFCH